MHGCVQMVSGRQRQVMKVKGAYVEALMRVPDEWK
jgi:hypothetical protein